MSVNKSEIISRGLAQRCPNCGGKTLFPERSLHIHRRCPVCHTGLYRGEGFFLGPWVLNYGVAVFGVVIPTIVLGNFGVIPWMAAFIIAGLGCTILPILLYRPSWGWWLAMYFYFLPHRLPANGGTINEEDED